MLSFFVPSTTARVACIVPIVGGIITALGINHRGRLAGLLMIACAQEDSIWNVGIKTAAAQNMIAYGTDTFAVRDFVRTGIPLTVLAYACILLLAGTYWKWLDYV